MAGTYASFLLVLGASAAAGQAVFALCGRPSWSWLSPAVGLAVLVTVAWGAVRLPGEGIPALVALGLVLAGSLAALRARPVSGIGPAIRVGGPLALAALLLASLPFLVEGRFGVLGTGLNPDMSQHLFATHTLAHGGVERLISEGYPLGPHALVVALSELGPGLVQGFNGLMLATAVAACLAPMALIGELPTARRWAGALLIGFPYLVASYLIQGSFKETLQAVFLLAFAIGVIALVREWEADPAPRRLRALPLAALAVGSVYAYSFPGLAWIAGGLGLWAVIELGRAARRGGPGASRRALRRAAPAALVALGVAAVAIAPEAGRLINFADFETFNPPGPGVGNLFDRLSPLETLGVWPSGDFRVEPGAGAVPAIVFWLGSAFGLGVLAFGVRWSLRQGETVAPAMLAAAAVIWLYSLLVGTAYQESKALVLASPLVALISVRALVTAAPAAVVAAFAIAAGGSSMLALVNGPVGPSGYTPALNELRSELPKGSVVVRAPAELLADQHGRDYLVWELRGNRICVEELRGGAPSAPPAGYAAAVVVDADGAIEPRAVATRAGAGPGPCPFVSDGQRAEPGAAGG